jgi:hypothetical protein
MNRNIQSYLLIKRSRPTALFATAVLFALLLSLISASSYPANSRIRPLAPNTPDAPQDPPPPRCCGSDEDEHKPHLLAASYYSLKNGLSSKLLLNNKGPRPLEVKPTLFSMNGERHEVAPMKVKGASFRVIDLRKWVKDAGPQFREGSIKVFHLGRDLVLGAQVYVEDEAHSLSFEEKFAEPATMASSRLRGVWWLPSQKGEVSLAISNTSDSTVTVTARANGAQPARAGSITIELLPHETRLLDVQSDLLRKVGRTMSRLGGISVEHSGPAGAVLARGFAQETAKGYSLAVQFSDPGASKSSGYQGAGLRLGEVGGEPLTPVAVAHNAGVVETTVTGRLPYTTAGGATAEVTLPEVHLSPGETATIDVAGAIRDAAVPQGVTGAGLEFEYSTEPGSVQMAALSVGDGGNQVFRLPLWDVAAQRSATGGYPWFIDGSSSTLVYLKNVTAEQQQYTLRVGFEGGEYLVGVKSIEPRQTITFDLRELRDQQVPDDNGVTIPLTAERGQIIWSVYGPDGVAMIGRSEQADAVKGVSNNYACMSCCADSYVQAKVEPATSSVGVGGTTTYVAKEQRSTCNGQPAGWYNITPTWSSLNTSVATVSSGGAATGAAAGTTNVKATWTAYSRFPSFAGCQSTSFQVGPVSPINVVQVTFQKSDGTALPSPFRIGITSLTLAGATQDRTQHLKAVVTPAAQATNITIEPSKVTISNVSKNADTGVVTFDAVGVTPSDNQGDGSITAKIGSTVVGTQTVTVVIPGKLTHDVGGSLIIQNVAMNSTTTPPNSLPATQFQLNTNYYRLFTVTVKDKWDVHVGDVYLGAEVTEIVGNNPEVSINNPLTSSGTYPDPVGRIKEGAVVQANDPQVAAWPNEPPAEALISGTCDPSTQNITVKVAGFTLTPAISRSVDLCRTQNGTYTLQVTWP